MCMVFLAGFIWSLPFKRQNLGLKSSLSNTVRFQNRYNRSTKLFLCLVSEEPSVALQMQDGLELGSKREFLFGSKRRQSLAV